MEKKLIYIQDLTESCPCQRKTRYKDKITGKQDGQDKIKIKAIGFFCSDPVHPVYPVIFLSCVSGTGTNK